MRSIALLSGAVLSAAVLSACDGGAAEPPFLPDTSPTVTATPTPDPEAELESFREFARLIDDAVEDGDGSLVESRAVSNVEFVVEGDLVLLGELSGRLRSSFESLVSNALADQSDEFGTGEANLSALARRAKHPAYGENRYQAVVTAIVPQSRSAHAPYNAPYRSIAVYEFAVRDGRWWLVLVLMDPHSGMTTEPSPAAWLRGECDTCFDHWERWEGPP